MAWRWVSAAAAIAAHQEQLVQHGGANGVRDESLVHSAMARAPNLAAYGDRDVASLAAAYAYGLARNHAFIDGNKRTAAVISETFLKLNGRVLLASDAQIVVTFVALAAGELTEDELADWFRAHLD